MALHEQIQNTSHIQSTATSNPSPPPPASLADHSVPSPTSSKTITQGPPPLSFDSDPHHKKLFTKTSVRNQTPAAATHLDPISRQTRSHSAQFSKTFSVPPPLVRVGNSETRFYSLTGNQTFSASSPKSQSTMLATENTSAHFTLTSPLLPPSLANTSATAPPPSSNSSSRKKAKNRLTLNSLPRFPQPPSHSIPPSMVSPLSNHYTYSHQYTHQYTQAGQYSHQQQQSYMSAQQQLQIHQKDLIQQATRGTLPSHLLFPVSPRLIPMGSPGPVTPLTLEECQGGYLFAGTTSSSSGMPFMHQREMDKLSAIAAAQN
ncbi:hypothetical protein DFH27DRAFT_612167 [Peziza echinospora]|nr:hypothetical protein DFH27DRAFT_612167 [Peziza echinospora]